MKAAGKELWEMHSAGLDLRSLSGGGTWAYSGLVHVHVRFMGSYRRAQDDSKRKAACEFKV